MLSIKNAKKLLPVLAALLIAVLSVFVLTDKIPQLSFITQSLDSLEQSNQTVLRFTGSTMAASVAITALPDDFATPLASTLADINKYFVVILIAIFVERLILVEGIRLSLTYLIPAACILWAAARLLNNPTIRNFALRIVILGLAVILVVPCSTHFVDAVCSDYLQYVEDTI
ncbi:MAG: hypothetical protein HUJ80_09330, partial [Firmicutes bacterium]|nr:hypothetical protein [Bacillota bacterium]